MPSHSRNVQVLLDSPGGQTAVGLAVRYSDKLAEASTKVKFRRALWIAPNRFAVERAERLVLHRLPGGCFAPQVVTFEQFADRVLQAAPTSVRPISGLEKRWILRGILRRMAAEGELTYLASVAESAGLLDTLGAQISEFKRLEIWPEELAAALNRRPADAKDQELARIYAAYQEILNRHQWYDAEGRFWSARTLLRQGQRQLIRSLELVVVEGFTDFTRPQHEMLEVLAEEAAEMIVTLPLDPSVAERHAGREAATRDQSAESPPVPADLFAKALATLDELQRRLPSATVRAAGTAADRQAPIDSLRERLFRPPSAQASPAAAEPPAEQDGDGSPRGEVAVWHAVSRIGEIRGIAREIKSLLLAGRCRAEEILVVFRNLPEAAPLVDEVFRDYGIPVYVDASRPLEKSPFVRSLLSLLRLVETDWAYDELLAVIRNRHIRWPGLAARRNLSDAESRIAAERMVRELQIPAGRQALLDRLRTAGDAAASDRSRRAAAAWSGLSGLANFLDGAPSTGHPAEWAACIDRFYDLCGTPEEDPSSPDASPDAESLRRITLALHNIARADGVGSSEVGVRSSESRVPHSTYPASQITSFELFSDIAAAETLPSQGPAKGRVRIVSAIAARGAEARQLYFAGLSEQAMPQVDSGSGYYSSRETARLIGTGLPLVSPTQRYQDEMLLFYEVISNAAERLVLSYPALDEKAQPTLPSPFLAEVERAGGGHVQVRRDRELRPIDRDATPLSLREFRTRAVCDAVVDGSGTDRLAALSAAEGHAELATSIRAGLESIRLRSDRDAFSPAEGLFQSEEARRWIAGQFGPDRHWSPTALEQYARCPFSFFLERVLGVAPLDDLELATDYRRRGRLVHQCLAELYQRFGSLDASQAISAQCDAEGVEREIRAFVDQARHRLADGGFSAALEALDLQQVADLAEQFHQQQIAYDGWAEGLSRPPLPAHFEVRFGPPRHESDSEADAILSTDRPFGLDLGDERILLTGRVDRIDIGAAGQTQVFNIVDYKTGAAKALKEDDVRQGLQLQIPLYALAVEEGLLADQGAIAWRADYWWLRDDGFGKGTRGRKGPFSVRELRDGELVETQDWQELKHAMLERVRQIVHGVREGQFVVYSQDPDCTRTCPYCSVCRVGQVRTLEKTWPTEGSADS